MSEPKIDYSALVPAVTVRAVRQADALAQLKQRRDKAVFAGIVINGMPVATDEVSQSRITGAALQAVVDPAVIINWKAGPRTFVTLTAPQILGIATAVRAHVQACFDHEAKLVDEIMGDGTPDINAGWPGNPAT